MPWTEPRYDVPPRKPQHSEAPVAPHTRRPEAALELARLVTALEACSDDSAHAMLDDSYMKVSYQLLDMSPAMQHALSETIGIMNDTLSDRIDVGACPDLAGEGEGG